MPLPNQTLKLIEFLRPRAIANVDFFVSSNSGSISIDSYNGPGIVPTEQELIDAENDLTLNGAGQNFTSWFAENGGDDTVTTKRKAKERIDLVDEIGAAQLAELEQRNKRDNYLATRLEQVVARVQAMLDSSGGVSNMRTAGLAVSVSAINTRPRGVAVTDYKDAIDTPDPS